MILGIRLENSLNLSIPGNSFQSARNSNAIKRSLEEDQ